MDEGQADSDKPNGDDSVDPDPGAVEAILDQLEKWTEEERKRAETLSQRAAWLLAFCGVILGLGTNQADQVLQRSGELGSVGRVLASVSLALAVVLVAAAAWFSLKVLFTARKRTVVIDDDEVAGALKDEHLREDKAWNQLRTAQVYQKQIPNLRKQNNAMFADLFKAFVALLIAVVLFVAHAGVFLENSIEGEACPTATVPASVANARGSPAAIYAQATETAQAKVRVPPCPKTTTVPG